MSVERQNTKRNGYINKASLIAATLTLFVSFMSGCEPGLKNRLNTTDQTKLARIAVEEPDYSIRIAAVRNLNDQNVLEKVALEDKDKNVRSAAVERLTNQALLERLALYEEDNYVRITALRNLTNQAILANLALKEENMAIRLAAVETLTDQTLLAKIALEDRDSYVRCEAARRLIMKEALEKTAIHATDRDVLRILLSRLEDNAVPKRISFQAIDPAMRLAASQKAGMKSWAQIFYTEKTVDFLAAVLLSPYVQPDVVHNIRTGCMYLISQGDQSHIQLLVDLLGKFGGQSLAEDYINCGQPDLANAGFEWAKRYGYTVRHIDKGSKHVIWGDHR